MIMNKLIQNTKTPGWWSEPKHIATVLVGLARVVHREDDDFFKMLGRAMGLPPARKPRDKDRSP